MGPTIKTLALEALDQVEECFKARRFGDLVTVADNLLKIVAIVDGTGNQAADDDRRAALTTTDKGEHHGE